MIELLGIWLCWRVWKRADRASKRRAVPRPIREETVEVGFVVVDLSQPPG